jgi:hypothetical protein
VVVFVERELVVVVGVVGEIQQVAEADGVEGPEEAAADVAEQEEEVEQLLGEQQLGVADGEAHGREEDGWMICGGGGARTEEWNGSRGGGRFI